MSRWLILAKYYPTGGPETQIGFTTGFGFVSLPTSSPASKEFASRIQQALDLQRDLVSQDRLIGRSSAGVGTIEIKNADGLLDALYDAGWDGREVLAYWGDESATITSGYTQVIKGTGLQAEGGRRLFKLNIRDRSIELDVNVQTSKYSGAGGLNGAADLEGKFIPKLFGKVRNVPCVLVDPVKLIYQISDAACTPSEVRDSGLALSFSPANITARTSGVVTRLRAAATDGNGTWVDVGDAGVIRRSTDDGVTWAAAASSPLAGTPDLYCVAWDPTIGKFVLGGASGTLYYSADGSTWTQISGGSNPFGGAEIVNEIASNGAGTLVAVGSLGISASSTTATSFTSRANGFAGGNIKTAAWGDNVFVMANTGRLESSPTGVTWTLQTTSLGSTYASRCSITFGKGVYAAAFGDAGGNGDIWTSVDLKVWTFRLITTNLERIRYGGRFNLFLAVGGSGTLGNNFIWTSASGEIWTSYVSTSGGTNIQRGIGVSASGSVVICGDAGKVESPTSVATYANTTDLQDSTLKPVAGTYKYYSGASGTYIRLGGPPAGLVTADAESTTATGTAITQALLAFANLSAGDWSAADFTQLTTDQPAKLELWTGTDQMTVTDAVDYIIRGIGGYWTFDRTGIFRCGIIKDPSSGSSVATIVDPAPGLTGDVVGNGVDCVQLRDSGQGVPTYEHVLQYSKNYAVQNSDLARNVTDSARAGFGKLYYTKTSTDASVQTKHKLATSRTVTTCFAEAADATTEVARLQALWGADRKYYEFPLPVSATNLQRDLGQIITLKSPRFSGLSSGKKHLVVKVGVDAAANRINAGVWG